MKWYGSENVYVAGPLFDEGERWWIEQIEQTITAIGFNTFLPHRDNPEKTPETVQTILKIIVTQSARQTSSSQTSTVLLPMMEQRGNSDMPQHSKTCHRDLY